MQVRNHEIIVFRGESWTLSKLIKNRDDSPYIISNAFRNPYWLITVASSLYNKTDGYYFNKWLSLKDVLRFTYTKPISLKSINSNYTFDNTTIPSGYEGDETSGYANIAIFYDKDDNGVIKYKYWEYNDNREGNYEGQWVDYFCPIVTTFGTDITSNWIEQNYYYRILLVDGLSTFENLKNIAEELDIDTTDLETVEDLYEFILQKDENSVKDVDISRPLSTIDEVTIILEPTKLYVKSNLKGVKS